MEVVLEVPVGATGVVDPDSELARLAFGKDPVAHVHAVDDFKVPALPVLGPVLPCQGQRFFWACEKYGCSQI